MTFGVDPLHDNPFETQVMKLLAQRPSLDRELLHAQQVTRHVEAVTGIRCNPGVTWFTSDPAHPHPEVRITCSLTMSEFVELAKAHLH